MNTPQIIPCINSSYHKTGGCAAEIALTAFWRPTAATERSVLISSRLRKRSHIFFRIVGISSLRAGFFEMRSSSIPYSKQALVHFLIFPTAVSP